MGIGETGAFFHQRHDRGHDIGMLLVRRQVDNQISAGDEFFIAADTKIIFRGVLIGLTFFLDCRGPQGVSHVQAAVTQIQPLIQSLRAAADDDDFFAFQVVNPAEFRGFHETAFGQFR